MSGDEHATPHASEPSARARDAEATHEETRTPGATRAAEVPGLVRVFTAGHAAVEAQALGPRGLRVGRATGGHFDVPDERLSRHHFTVSRADGGLRVDDAASRNGTWVDGRRAEGAQVTPPAVVRAGRSVFVVLADVTPFAAPARLPEGLVAGAVCGPTLARSIEAVGRRARARSPLSLRGESGSGKELAARAYHAASGGGPFVAVNCAAIPEGMAERLLFGTKRGAYSGAQADAEGFVGAADGGTLFLDEVAELDLAVQAKLLRVLEHGEVTPLGAARPTPVDFRLVLATHRDLREAVARGAFRDDLFYRVGVDGVRVPPLRERPEDVARLVEDAARDAAPGLEVDATLVEACLLRPWPGNVRELLAEVRVAAREAAAAGRLVVDASDLAAAAGLGATPPARDDARDAEARPRPDEPEPSGEATLPPDDVVEAKLLETGGNVSRAARELGVHRTQLRRWVERRAALKP